MVGKENLLLEKATGRMPYLANSALLHMLVWSELSKSSMEEKAVSKKIIWFTPALIRKKKKKKEKMLWSVIPKVADKSEWISTFEFYYLYKLI